MCGDERIIENEAFQRCERKDDPTLPLI
jgi:hypothetical protein